MPGSRRRRSRPGQRRRQPPLLWIGDERLVGDGHGRLWFLALAGLLRGAHLVGERLPRRRRRRLRGSGRDYRVRINPTESPGKFPRLRSRRRGRLRRGRTDAAGGDQHERHEEFLHGSVVPARPYRSSRRTTSSISGEDTSTMSTGASADILCRTPGRMRCDWPGRSRDLPHHALDLHRQCHLSLQNIEGLVLSFMVLKREGVSRLDVKDLPGVPLVLGEDDLVPPRFGDSSHRTGSLS